MGSRLLLRRSQILTDGREKGGKVREGKKEGENGRRECVF